MTGLKTGVKCSFHIPQLPLTVNVESTVNAPSRTMKIFATKFKFFRGAVYSSKIVAVYGTFSKPKSDSRLLLFCFPGDKGTLPEGGEEYFILIPLDQKYLPYIFGISTRGDCYGSRGIAETNHTVFSIAGGRGAQSLSKAL